MSNEAASQTHRLNVGNPVVNDKTNILDIAIPAEMDREVDMGIPHLNTMFTGNGITPGTITFVTGVAGGGKSTLMAQVADACMGLGHVSMHNTGEESLYQVRRVVRRLELKNGFHPSYHSDVLKLIEAAETRKAKMPKGQDLFLFVDSLQTLEYRNPEQGRGRPMSHENQIVEAMWQLTAFAKRTWSMVFVIGQVKKDGQFAGSNELKHAIDCHLHLDIDSSKKSDTYGQRTIEMQKNRYGSSGIYFPYEINNKGLNFEV
jgi:DNA repair protein RadA/Sms